ncbi:transient receptor potential cation channel subfamily M member 5-like isoform X1 [Acipenser oxyrinchus oxyrinchus]|uniref:Transient receptor potential cation channel subfamily M member 5-like isoform X1 n=1 Tax=Acipenser oxyrinchus oxyrinchus TaxID=40147 RepID=A0AAD8FY62_ACIOX|nr:transient receptor potential cation channel subfamily M member 5-like isoform X1 [Acipenser oxyrinchus oxyrinchus]
MPVIQEKQQNVALRRVTCSNCGENLEYPQGRNVEGVCRCFYTANESKVSPVQGIHKRDERYNGCRSDNPRKREPMHRVGNIEFKGSGKKRGKFVIEHCTTDPAALYEVLTEEWNLTPPHLVVSLVGGDEDFQMKPWLRDTLRKGLVKAAQSTGAWIVTSGLRVGITRHVGEAVRDHSLASTSSKVKVIAIGIAPWKMIHDKETLLTAKPDKPAFYETAEQPSGSLYSLDSNHSHFILVDEDERHKDGTTEMRIKLLKHISEQRTGYGGTGIEIPVLCLLVHGQPHILERIYRGMLNSTPWLILAGSGGIADILVDMMSRPCDPDYVQEQLQEKFHTEFAWTDILKCTKIIQIILEHRHLLTIHNPGQEGSDELDTVILKALVKACKSQSQEAQEYLDELKLAVAWNRVDIAKSEIFSGEVEWRPCDLEEVMMDALVSNKPDFVKLFIDNGMNMCDFLTYSKLQDLYCAIPPKCLLHQLLQKKHEETKLSITARNDSMADSLEQKPKFTLYEVSRVLKDFLHDSCKGFYQETTKRGTMERASISRVSHVQKASLNMNQKCENPWRDLFLWAVLQNRQEMANYFWATGPEAVAAALAGCKILKEMAHLESEAESARSMKEAKYEQFALDLFSECYTNSEDRAFSLLVRKTKSWNKTTCLDLATEADAKSFFAHDGVQSHLTKMWWGAMKSDTRIWKLVLSFFCPPLIYTKLITFSEDEHHTVGGAEQFKELDSQDSEKAMLLTQRQNSDTIKPEKQVTASNNVCMKFLFTRWKKFWGAPVTVFLGNVIMYFAFLFLFTYVILVDFQPPPPYGPSIPEITLYFWVFTLVLEELRQSFFTDEDTSIIKKFKLYVEDSWNKCDMVAILLFVLGVSCRMAGSTYEAGRTVLALDFMVFALRLIHIFAIHKQLGPKIIIVERMMKDVFFFLFFLSVWLIAYGVATQALLHPNDTRVDWIFRRVLYRPYLHIFGQIPLEEIDGARMPEQNCTIDPIEIMKETFSPCPNLYANWLVILLLVIFLLVTNVLLLNLLIAMFSYTFQVVQGNADIFWKFQRYNLIVEYFSRPSLAPPFIIISHISQVICSMFKNAEPKQELLERDFPEGLDQKLMTWETVQKENYLANLEKEERESSEERLKKTSHKVDSLLKIIGGFKEQEKRLVTVETQIKYCSDVLSWLADCFTQSSLKCNRAAPKHSSSMVSGSKKQQRCMAEEESTARRTDILMTDLKYIDD